MIQTKKVQYYCMSKLSAKELANRAHQFLAEGDKKKSAQSLQQSKKEIQNNHNNAGKIAGEHFCIISVSRVPKYIMVQRKRNIQLCIMLVRN